MPLHLFIDFTLYQSTFLVLAHEFFFLIRVKQIDDVGKILKPLHLASWYRMEWLKSEA